MPTCITAMQSCSGVTLMPHFEAVAQSRPGSHPRHDCLVRCAAGLCAARGTRGSGMTTHKADADDGADDAGSQHCLPPYEIKRVPEPASGRPCHPGSCCRTARRTCTAGTSTGRTLTTAQGRGCQPPLSPAIMSFYSQLQDASPPHSLPQDGKAPLHDRTSTRPALTTTQATLASIRHLL